MVVISTGHSSLPVTVAVIETFINDIDFQFPGLIIVLCVSCTVRNNTHTQMPKARGLQSLDQSRLRACDGLHNQILDQQPEQAWSAVARLKGAGGRMWGS